MLQISFSGVVYNQPETPQAIRRAIVLLEDRLRELEGQAPPASRTNGRANRLPPPQEEPASGKPLTIARAQIYDAKLNGERGNSGEASQPVRRPVENNERVGKRWFVDRWPRIAQPSGNVEVVRTLEALNAFLKSNGLEPHRRGDASMLLWQVRERLHFPVEAVPRPGE
ncbi:MAG: hypothetical protein EXR47_03185 [Dehalococcoidia bacterium]|nr:hypothetical protein [Dehalococcoidia bacterium]